MAENRTVDRLAERTLELVDISSESRAEDEALDYVRGLMPSAPAYDDDTVLFWPGRIVLAGHLDTVPAQGNLPGLTEDGWIVGLGASDMKGGCAVMVELARTGAPFGFLFFGREELPAGESPLPRFFDTHRLECDLVVMMEPTDNEIHAGCLGNLNARATFRGESAHSARPWTGVNAIALAIDALGPLAAVEPRDVEIQGLVFREGRAEVELLGNSPPGRVAAESPLVRALRDVGNLRVAPKQAWTPVAEFSAQGLDAINFGPGATRYAHRQDERVEIASLRHCYDILERFAATVSP